MPKLNSKATVNEPGAPGIPETDLLSGLADVPYESALGELERLVAAMESAQLPLDRLLESYQRGAVLLKICRQRLEAVEEQVKILDNEQLKSWEGEA